MNTNVQDEMKKYKFTKRHTSRYDQTDMPHYPRFEKGVLDISATGWGTNIKHLKYKTAHPQKDLSMDRHHLKYHDTNHSSKFNGKPSGFH